MPVCGDFDDGRGREGAEGMHPVGCVLRRIGFGISALLWIREVVRLGVVVHEGVIVLLRIVSNKIQCFGVRVTVRCQILPAV